MPARSVAPAMADSAAGKVVIPFEGDSTSAIILNEAFLLAEDWKVGNPTILRQISPAA